MASVHIVIPTLCAVIGMVISLLLLLLLRRQIERQPEWLAGMLLGTAVFLMYASIFVSNMLTQQVMSNGGWLFFLSTRVLVATAAFVPVIILFGWRVSTLFQSDPPVGTKLLCFSVLTAVATAGFIWFGPVSIATDSRINQALVWNALINLFPGFRGLLNRNLSEQLTNWIKITGTFYLIGLAASLVASGWLKESSLSYTVVVFVQQMCCLVGILGSFIFMTRFRFADVFVKWSLRVVILGVISTVAVLAISVAPHQIGIEPSVFSLLVESVLLFGLIALAIMAAPSIDSWAERWVLQQADFKGQLLKLSSEMFGLSSEADLLSWLCAQLQASLQLQKARTIPSTKLPNDLADELSTSVDPLELDPYQSIPGLAEANSFEALLPIMVEGKLRYAVAICTGRERSPLLSGEVKFLRSVTTQAGAHIRHMEAEESSRQQTMKESLLSQQVAEAELRALRAQLNPHFLFNSLNTIAELIATNPENAERMTVRLARIFRYVLAQSHRQFTSISEEFRFLRDYLQIEQERFGDRLNVCFSLDPVLAQARIPTLLLQPIVENALKHGLSAKAGHGTLQVSATSQDRTIKLTVTDDGLGFDCNSMGPVSTLSAAVGVGLTNTLSRLRTIYGDHATLAIESAPTQGCNVNIIYPLEVPLYALTHH